MAQNYKNLGDFMNKYKLEKGSVETFTHTKLNGGKWKIPSDKLPIFFELYHNDIFNNTNNSPSKFNTLTEANSKVTQIKIDLDFRYVRDDNAVVRIYDIEDIVRVCDLYMRIIDTYLIVPGDKRMCFIMEKEHAGVVCSSDGKKRTTANNKLVIKDGVHIMFPNIVTHSKIAHKIREEVLQNIGNILDKYNFTNSYSDIVDKSVIESNNWFLYGSHKATEAYTYTVTKILKYDSDRNIEYIPLTNYTNLEYIKLFSILERDITEPWRLSVREIHKHILDNENLAIKGDVLKHKNESLKKTRKTCIKEAENLQYIVKIVDCLDVSLRAHNYREWIELGWCLHNIHNVDDTLLNKWIEFSKRDPLYAADAEESCRREWINAKSDGFGYGTLIMWAQMDSDNLAESRGGRNYLFELQNSTFDEKVKYCVSKNNLEQNDIAKLMHAHFKHDYVCVCKNKSKYVWYKFENHRWHELNSHGELRLKLSNILAKKFSKVSESFLHQYNSQADESANTDVYLDFSTRANNVSKKLKQAAFKNSIITECQDEFINEAKDFIDRMDENPNLLGCMNGVYDLKNLEFRDGRPDDYITLSTKIDYNDEFSWDHPTIMEIMKVIEQILPIKSVREYTLLVLSTTLDGSTKQEKFYILAGSGGNGKSKLIEMLDLALGDYSKNVSVALLTKKRADSNSANPELAATKGRRVVKFQEAEENSVLNVGLMKEISGGDKIVTRALFQDPIEFKPQFKAFFICNDKPTLPPNDEGTWRRVRLIEFISRFVDKPSEDPSKHEHPIDYELSDKIKGWGEAFLWILIEYYKQYRKAGGIVEPEEVLQYTTIYRRQNDNFLEFYNDYIETETNGRLLLTDAYKAYKQWFKENQQGTIGAKPKKKEDLRNYLIKQIGPEYDTTQSMHKLADERIKGTCWLGYKLHDYSVKTSIVDALATETDELDG
jgi:P4 family phage/plasmid primase-like protien